MVSYEEEERIYHKGFRDGWMAAQGSVDEVAYRYGVPSVSAGAPPTRDHPSFQVARKQRKRTAGSGRRKKQSRKQALLHEMSQKAWKSYKRKYPKGKKTYIQIRAQVSRSQAYKKKAKRLG